MPNCPCPTRIFQPHEIHTDEDVDWTIPADREDWDEQFSNRLSRNIMIKTNLLAGNTVQFRSSGNSLYPIVESGDSCVFEPVDSCKDLRMGWDIVFCEVQPTNRFFAHKVLYWEWEPVDPPAGSAPRTEPTYRAKYWIGNNKGHINGHCYEHQIYGRLVETVW